MTEAYPLHWPAGKPRTPSNKIEHSRFEPNNRPTEVAAIQREIRLLGGRNVLVSTNLRLRGDGMPYARDRAPSDAGVAVYFDYAGGQKCFACDRWRTIEENLRAIHKSIEAIRGLERWGSKDFVEAAFTGFAALPSPEMQKPWWEVLGISQSAGEDDIRAAYRKRAMEYHQRGASETEMADLNIARDRGLQERANG